MPPAASPTLMARQNIPSCVTVCLLTTPVQPCLSLNDGPCLCSSPTFIPAVGACLNTGCKTIADLQAGYDYAGYFCAAYNVTLPETTITALPAGATGTNGVPMTPVTPALYGVANFQRISIIMGTVCGILLAISIGLGVWNMRVRLRREREESKNREWTGVTSQAPGQSYSKSQSQSHNADLPPIASTSKTKKFFSTLSGGGRPSSTSAARGQLSFSGSSVGQVGAFSGRKSPSGKWDDSAQLTSHTFGAATGDSSNWGTETNASGIELDYVTTPTSQGGWVGNRDPRGAEPGSAGTGETFVLPRVEEEEGKEDWGKTHAK